MVRIRKNASRLLGSDYLLYPPLPAQSWGPHSSSYTASAAEEEEEGREGEAILCRLNSSPWDVIGTHLDHSSCCFQEEEGGDEGRGIMGNGLNLEEYEEILSTFESLTSSPVPNEIELKSKDDIDPKKVKKKRGRKRKREEENASEDRRDRDIKSVIAVCSKNDGKGWHCKRPANPRHTLCDHHLDLLRNYSSRSTNGSRESYGDSETERSKPVTVTAAADHETVGDGISVKRHRPKAAASETVGDDFYYYSGFGPWRGKKRSSAGTTSSYSRGKEDEKMEERKVDSGDESDDGPVAGDDLDDDEDDDVESRGRIVKKKGRKRVKARSLKSLM